MFSQTYDKKEYTLLFNSLVATWGSVKNKYYRTNPFTEAINTAMPKIMKDNKQLNEIPNDCGVIFTDKGFAIYITNPTPELKLVCYGFVREALTTYGYLTNENTFAGIAADLKDGVPFNNTSHLGRFLNSVLVTLYFIHNCEIEKKIIKPKEKYREGGNKHYNESKSDIIMLDCKWFTEMIRDSPFHVNGHYRWQVHGEKKTKRKLIWISDFEKHGYHRKATIEKLQNN